MMHIDLCSDRKAFHMSFVCTFFFLSIQTVMFGDKYVFIYKMSVSSSLKKLSLCFGIENFFFTQHVDYLKFCTQFSQKGSYAYLKQVLILPR